MVQSTCIRESMIDDGNKEFTVPKVLCPKISILALRKSSSSDIQGWTFNFRIVAQQKYLEQL